MKIPFNKILFLDIETVPICSYFKSLNENMQNLWTEKTKYQRKDEYSPEEFFEMRGGVFSEFAKIICISIGILYEKDSVFSFKIKSFYNDDEQIILQDFKKLLNEKFNSDTHYLCAHNGKEFDYPFIARRMIINGITLPKLLNIAGKKPWEVKHLDTMEMWKFGDYKHYTSVKLLTEILNIPTPKDDIDGSQVATVYWKDNDLEKIVKYCEKDTLTVAQIYLRLQNLSIVEQENIRFSL